MTKPLPPTLDCISIQLQGAVALIQFNRPRKGNALNQQTFQEMLIALRWATTHPDVRVIVQSGQGKYFTTGLDLSDSIANIHENEEEPIIPEETIRTLDAYHQILITTDKILMAAVNGPGIGYGLSSIALFDFVYSVPDAYFFVPFVKLGVCAEACSSITLPRILGRQRASMLLLANERIGAAELRDAGLISRIVTTDKLMTEVMQVAENITRLPPDSLAANKALLMRPYHEELLLANEMELRILRERVRSQEAKRAIRVVSEERKKQQGHKTRSKL